MTSASDDSEEYQNIPMSELEGREKIQEHMANCSIHGPYPAHYPRCPHKH